MAKKDLTKQKANKNSEIIDEEILSYELIKTQYTLRHLSQTTQTSGVLVLVNGMENSGKGKAVTQLREWLDPRLIKVHATMGQYPSEYQPIWQRHTKQLPRNGEVAVYFGNWYADLVRYVFDSNKQLDQEKFKQMLEDIEAFEEDLRRNHTIIIKCWFSVDSKTLKKRLLDDEPDPEQFYYIDWHKKSHIKLFQKFSEQLLKSQNNWYQINGEDNEHANVIFAQIVLRAMQQATDSHCQQVTEKPNFPLNSIPQLLNQPNIEKIAKADYKKLLKQKQILLAKLLRQRGRRHIIFVFEGMDAAGKGGAIKRIIQPLDPREYEIHPISAPMDYEKQHPYLWRFWNRLPKDKLADIADLTKYCPTNILESNIAIFDRSWYGRVLVERIEGFASNVEWQRAYEEINRFETDLSQSNAVILKFWLAISKDEQLKRFESRQKSPNKHHKITDEDWRNREKWQDYVQAAADMLALTSTENNPWHIIATNDKYTARLMVLQYAIDRLTQAFQDELS